jgi:hypothetical protein
MGVGNPYKSTLVTHHSAQTLAKGGYTKSSLGGASHTTNRQKRFMAVPGFEPGSSGSQPLMLTTTLYHHGWNTGVRVDMKIVASWVDHKSTWPCSWWRVSLVPPYNCFDSSVGRALD